jgi:hypothetical protein
VNTFLFKRTTTLECPLLGSISVNIVQHATMGAVFSARGPCRVVSRSWKLVGMGRREL